MTNVVMLAADTPRTSAYAQALAYAGNSISQAAIVKPAARRWGQASALEKSDFVLEGLFLPDLSIPALSACAEICHQLDVLECDSMNDPDCVRWVTGHSPDLVIFSGFGGELVKSELLGCGAPLLHMHAGWLPDYRGSTTVYYSLLENATVGVSAITLSEQIDSGPLVARKRYPPPPRGLDIDYYYDSAVRADLLVEVIKDYLEHGQLGSVAVAPEEAGRDYFIIHPLLKHIALSRYG